MCVCVCVSLITHNENTCASRGCTDQKQNVWYSGLRVPFESNQLNQKMNVQILYNRLQIHQNATAGVEDVCARAISLCVYNQL